MNCPQLQFQLKPGLAIANFWDGSDRSHFTLIGWYESLYDAQFGLTHSRAEEPWSMQRKQSQVDAQTLL
ncbi:hypothetical protein T12_4293 [Trichinella patagoniensis]|uniref:Uncharacterized protein n=1 Tax=Trichinella patagoniensis TaxID=990121 RepID=A0A0V0Z4G0_9BILA|nr:hypothetical protein T12_11115 [Trichinella patagoniensis]KRY07034.1 hypothetical protein T12_4293 [Trichinella patagoniensis]